MMISKDNALMTCAQMAAADRRTIDAGTSGLTLMERAGAGIYQRMLSMGIGGPIIVLAGPGNNGGDGYVVARLARADGYTVHIVTLVDPKRLKGDALQAAQRWDGPVPLDAGQLNQLPKPAMIVDALFGAGLSRPLEGAAQAMLQWANNQSARKLAVDVPSGVFGDSGQASDGAFKAEATVTFHCRKPAHMLSPGRDLCGEVHVIDIGLLDDSVEALGTKTIDGQPAGWLHAWPQTRPGRHKYNNGHVLVFGGRRPFLGAGRLASLGALRAGAGLVSLTCDPDSAPTQAGALAQVMVHAVADQGDFRSLLADDRRNTLLLGPGAGSGALTQRVVRLALETKRATVLDADALTAFASDPDQLFKALHDLCVLTPHDGEFKRLFGDQDTHDRLAQTQGAAKLCGAVVLRKGADTIIAAPDGRAMVFGEDLPQLATGGTGDALAGLLAGLLGQGMVPFEATGAACWIQREAARPHGRGTLVEEMLMGVPRQMSRLDEMAAENLW